MDVTQPMEILEDNSFDLIIDKGCLDSVLCGDLPLKGSAQMLSNVYRVLNEEGGVYACISHAGP